MKIFKNKSVKIISIIFALIAPVIIIMLIITPFAKRKYRQNAIEFYQMPEDFVKQDIINFVEKMRYDRGSQLHFKVLDEDQIASATKAATKIMFENRAKDKLYQQVIKKQKEIAAIGYVFDGLGEVQGMFDETDNAVDYKELSLHMVYDDFILRILAASYKSIYDIEFDLKYDRKTRFYAEKAQSILLK